jgi:hypothetical protein
MPTTFVLHDAAAESSTDGLWDWPVFDYTSWSVELAALARNGTSPTLDVKLQGAAVTGDEDYWSDVTSGAFTQVTSGDTLPTSETLPITLDAGTRYIRLYQAIGGTDSAWWIYRVKGTVVLFDTTVDENLDLLADRTASYSDLSDLAEKAEDDVVRRYMVDGVLALTPTEDTGGALRRAIAGRIEWLLRERELENSGKPDDKTMLADHRKRQWREVDRYLAEYDERVPLVM